MTLLRTATDVGILVNLSLLGPNFLPEMPLRGQWSQPSACFTLHGKMLRTRCQALVRGEAHIHTLSVPSQLSRWIGQLPPATIYCLCLPPSASPSLPFCRPSPLPSECGTPRLPSQSYFLAPGQENAFLPVPSLQAPYHLPGATTEASSDRPRQLLQAFIYNPLWLSLPIDKELDSGSSLDLGGCERFGLTMWLGAYTPHVDQIHLPVGLPFADDFSVCPSIFLSVCLAVLQGCTDRYT